MEHDLEQATNMKLLLYAFKKLLWLKNNFHKANWSAMHGEAKQMEGQYTDLFGYGSRQYPFRYLGISVHHKKISNTN
jgi:hypothetical protein